MIPAVVPRERLERANGWLIGGVTLMQQMAHALGKTEDEARDAALFAKIKAAFGAAYIHQDGFVLGADNGPSPFGQINNPEAKSVGGDTQTGYVLALHMNLVPNALRRAAADRLVCRQRKE